MPECGPLAKRQFLFRKPLAIQQENPICIQMELHKRVQERCKGHFQKLLRFVEAKKGPARCA